jgi:hypothetical protein
MRLSGRIWKDGKFWLAEVPMLDATTQGHSEREALRMTADLVETMADKKGLKVAVFPRSACESPSPAPVVSVDGERIRLRASQELILECGQAKVTLTRAGKVIIDGAYVSSRSTGVNRLKGATVDVN